MALAKVRSRHGSAVAMMGVAASVLVALSSPAEAARRKAKPAGGGYNPPYAAMVVDVKTGRTLHAENEDALRHPASVTKVMTLYMLFEQLERGKLTLDSPLKVTPHAARMSPSKLYLKPGETISVEDAIKALVTKSANDVAATVAENLAESEDEFAEMMTRKARALGMSRTVFRNASGLPDPEQVTTARDLTVLARAVQDRFPAYYRYFQTRVFTYEGRAHANHNKLLGRVEGVDGIKTGFTNASGFNLMTNAKSDDRHIVAVVLGGRSGASRDQIVANLVRQNLPRAYAGARTAPAVAEGTSARAIAAAESARPAPQPERVASADVETTAGTTPARRPMDPATVRPVVASATGAASTTTPSSVRWGASSGPLPLNAHAYAAVQAPEAPAPRPAPAAPVAKIEDRLPAATVVAAKADPKPEPRVEAKAETKSETKSEARVAPRPSVPVSEWVIQLGATDEEDKAKLILDEAKARTGRVLAKAAPFTEKVNRDGSTLYRARFSGFDEAEEAQDACKALKRSGFACFATRS
ncbi:MAG TPA: serine hydrolase [Microvirga sp.]|jgi:D-alanyl-D-alanine carboxypeptidase|nr:serine hydrolase [Microvirga sp.]